MTAIKILKITTILGLMFSVSVANARYENDECKTPKIRSFTPAEHAKGEPVPEVDAEGEVGFLVSYIADPTTIRAVAKKKYKLKLTVEDRSPYYQVTANLPAELNGKYVRIDIKAKAQTGECVGKDGWLVKVRPASESVAEE